MKPTNNRVYCIGCKHTKMLFETQTKADNFIKFNRDAIASSSEKVPTRSYYCSFCCGWHVTSVEDEGKAEANDRRDENTWHQIMSLRRKKLPLTEEGQKLSEMLVSTQSLIQKCQRQLLLTNLGEALELMKDLVLEFSIIEDRARRQKIDSARIDKQRVKIKALQAVFDIVDEYDIDSETRQDYLGRDLESTNELARNYFQNKEFVEDIKHKISDLENGRTDISSEEYKQRFAVIASAINSYKGKGLSAVKQALQEKLNGLRCKIPQETTTQKKTSNHNATYVSIIELLEQAYTAVRESDFSRCEYLIKTAECLMPDSSDEISQILWNQIHGLKDQLHS